MRISDWSSDVCSSDLVRRSRQWEDHSTKEGLRIKRRYAETILREVNGAAYGRLPDGHNYTFTTYADDPAVWEREAIGADGRGLKQNILDFLKRMREEDLNCPLNFVDPQTDRSNPDAQATRSEEHTSELPSLMRL